MRMIALTLLFISSVCFAKTDLAIGASPSDSFTGEVAQDNPMQVIVKNLKTQKAQRITFKYSVSDTKKLTLTKTTSTIPVELAVVVLVVSNSEQSVKIIAPGSIKEALCSLRNEGDFSWVEDKDLKERVRISNVGQEEMLQLKIGNRKSGATQFSWVNCAAI